MGGRISLPVLNSSRRLLLPDTYDTVEQLCQFTIPVVGVGDDIETALMARYIDGSNYYHASIFWDGDSIFAEIRIIVRVAGVPTSLPLSNGNAHAGVAYTLPFTQLGAGLSAWLAFRVDGPTLSARAWAANGVPGEWSTATDPTFAAGQIGIRGNLQPGFTGALPVVVSADNYQVVEPQAVTLSARGVNGLTRAWPAGTPVDVWEPAIVALTD